MSRRRALVSVVILMIVVFIPLASRSPLNVHAAGNTATRAQATGGSVLILSTTVTNGSLSLEAQAASNLGFTVNVVDPATWLTMTTFDFSQYQAIILGDPTCQTDPSSALSAAEATTSVWGPAIAGNVVIIGTDPIYHATNGPGQTGAQELINNGIAFATSTPGMTGAYIDLSCYYAETVPPAIAPVPVLNGIASGGFGVVGQQAASSGCPENSHIVSASPVVANMTDADLSNWSCSTHEAFATWPSSFQVVAISEDIPSSFVAPDGTTGAPYILVSSKWGVDSISGITTSFYNQIVTTFGQPDFFGRKIGDANTAFVTDKKTGDPCVPNPKKKYTTMTTAEVTTAHALGLAILPFYFSFPTLSAYDDVNGVETWHCGEKYAKAIIEFARSAPGFAISQGKAIFVDIENTDNVGTPVVTDADFIQGWFDTFNTTWTYTSPYDGSSQTYQAGYYKAGYYANTKPTSSNFDAQFCTAVSRESAIGTASFIWTTQPNKATLSSTSPLPIITQKANAPSYSPGLVSCPPLAAQIPTPAAWQYAINGSSHSYKINVDIDEALPGLPLWHP